MNDAQRERLATTTRKVRCIQCGNTATHDPILRQDGNLFWQCRSCLTSSTAEQITRAESICGRNTIVPSHISGI